MDKLHLVKQLLTDSSLIGTGSASTAGSDRNETRKPEYRFWRLMTEATLTVCSVLRQKSWPITNQKS